MCLCEHYNNSAERLRTLFYLSLKHEKMGTLKIAVVASNGKTTSKEVQLAEEQPLRGLKNGSKIQLVAVAIDELGENADTSAVRAMVCRSTDNGNYPQYLLALKNGVTPAIVPISALGRQFDEEEYRVNDLTAQLSEASGYNALVESGATLKVTIRRGAYTYANQNTPTTGVRSISLEQVATGSSIAISDKETIRQFVDLIKSARDYANR